MKPKKMSRYWSVLVTAAALSSNVSATADALPAVPSAAIPTVEYIHRVLKSSSAVQSVDLYSMHDGFRFAIEYIFRNNDNQAVVSDIELLFDPDGSVWETDNIPREIPEETANEAQDLESKLDVLSKCHFRAVFDNLIPEPKARADWQRIDWPNK